MITSHGHSWIKVWVNLINKYVENLEKNVYGYRVKSVSFFTVVFNRSSGPV